MADSRSAGRLVHKVALDMRPLTGGDGRGNFEGKFEEQFQCRAEFIHLRGGEAVMAGRLEGHHTQVVRVRASSNTRRITSGWQLRDVRRDIKFNVRDVEQEENRQFIALTCESGVATG